MFMHINMRINKEFKRNKVIRYLTESVEDRLSQNLKVLNVILYLPHFPHLRHLKTSLGIERPLFGLKSESLGAHELNFWCTNLIHESIAGTRTRTRNHSIHLSSDTMSVTQSPNFKVGSH